MVKRKVLRQSIQEPQVNLTPLIDVVFVILIMFIVIAPLLQLDRIDLSQAKSQTADQATSVQESSPIAIHVQKDNSIWFSGKLIKIDQLPIVLKQMKANYPKARPQLFHDRQAHFGTYQLIKNSAEEAGFEELDIILKPS